MPNLYRTKPPPIPNLTTINRVKMTASKTNYVWSALSGLFLTAAFPKIGLSWFAWFAMVPFFMSIRDTTPGQGFRLGLTAGIFHHISLLYWLVYTMHTYGYLPIYQCVIILILMAAILSTFFGVFGWFSARIASSKQLWLLPFIWTSLEYIQTYIFTGFPWGFVGHSQYKQYLLIQIADIVGVYGISFLIITINIFLFLCFASFFRYRWMNVPIKLRTVGFSFLIGGILMSTTLYYGQQRIQMIDQALQKAPKTPITVIQGNIDQSIKWNAAFQNYTIKRYNRLSHASLSDKPQLIVWPETAAPIYFTHDKDLTQKVIDGVKEAQTSFLIGSPSVSVKGKDVKYFNSAFLIEKNGTISGKYDKVHLVPFGEYVPLKKYLPFVGKMVEQIGDFQPGKKGGTLLWRDKRLGIQICYEIIFPDLSRAMVRNGADLLINITNDAWFGATSAAYQHFAMTVFRAVENKRALARAANTGISGFIDPVGRIMATTPIYVEKIISRSIPLLKENTVYTRYGDVFAKTCLVLTIIIMWAVLFRGHRKTD